MKYEYSISGSTYYQHLVITVKVMSENKISEVKNCPRKQDYMVADTTGTETVSYSKQLELITNNVTAATKKWAVLLESVKLRPTNAATMWPLRSWPQRVWRSLSSWSAVTSMSVFVKLFKYHACIFARGGSVATFVVTFTAKAQHCKFGENAG